MTVTFAKLGQYGRLGNQLWQASAVIGYAMKYNMDFILPNWNYKNNFNIPLHHFSDKVISCYTHIEENFHYKEIPYYSNINLEGYFQSPFYWLEFKDSVIKMLTPNINVASCADYAFIHVRRGDYLKHIDCYEILDMNYYESAMQKINNKKYLIFSDDIPWCKKHFIGNQFEFSENNSNIIDLALMISCDKGGICANSSFSFWGGILSKNSNIIIPNKWFGPKLAPTHNTKDLIYNNWLKV